MLQNIESTNMRVAEVYGGYGLFTNDIRSQIGEGERWEGGAVGEGNI